MAYVRSNGVVNAVARRKGEVYNDPPFPWLVRLGDQTDGACVGQLCEIWREGTQHSAGGHFRADVSLDQLRLLAHQRHVTVAGTELM